MRIYFSSARREPVAKSRVRGSRPPVIAIRRIEWCTQTLGLGEKMDVAVGCGIELKN
jgi:hypothetical protein